MAGYTGNGRGSRKLSIVFSFHGLNMASGYKSVSAVLYSDRLFKPTAFPLFLNHAGIHILYSDCLTISGSIILLTPAISVYCIIRPIALRRLLSLTAVSWVISQIMIPPILSLAKAVFFSMVGIPL